MDGIDRINEKILAQARAEAKEILDQAQAEAGAVLDKARETAQKSCEEAVAKAKWDADELIRRQVAVAELESRKMRLAAKQELIEQAFAQALEKFQNMPREEYVGFLTGEILKAAKGGEEVVLSAKDREEIGLRLIAAVDLKALTNLKLNMVALSKETADISGGFILKKGAVEINNSLATLIHSHREDLVSEVVSALFE